MKQVPRLHPEFDADVESRYFTLRELCYTSRNLPNSPATFTQVANLRALADFLDEVRDVLGSPIVVNSGFRSVEVNSAVNGHPHSLHKQGRAADIWCIGPRVEDLIEILRQRRNRLSEFIVNRDKCYIHIAI